jgi:hypothetical protein
MLTRWTKDELSLASRQEADLSSGWDATDAVKEAGRIYRVRRTLATRLDRKGRAGLARMVRRGALERYLKVATAAGV